MRTILTVALLLALPLAAMAQGYSASPLLIVNGGSAVAQPAPEAEAPVAVNTDKMLSQFPSNAVTTVGNKAPVPEVPAANAAAISKLWPRDTVGLFMRSCARPSKDLVVPCNCIITNVMDQMTHEEFMTLSNAGTIEEDARFQTIRSQCATKPKQHQ